MTAAMHFAVVFLASLIAAQVHADSTASDCQPSSSPKKAPQCNCNCKDGRDGKDGAVTTKQYEDLVMAIGYLQQKVKTLEAKVSRNSLASMLSNRRFRVMFKRMRRPRGFFDSADFDPVKFFFGEGFNMQSHFTQPPPTKPPKTYPDTLGGVKDNAPQLDKEGKIPKMLLPSGYDKLSAADIQWQALHVAAAASCRSLTTKAGFPGIHNTVLLRNAAQGRSCRALCNNSWARHCKGEVSIWGKTGKGVKNGEEVANYLNFGCDLGFNGGSEAYAADDDISKELRPEHQHLYSYCCCSFY